MDGDVSFVASDVVDVASGCDPGFDTTQVVRSASQVRRITKVCLVDAARSNAEVVSLLKNHYGLEVFESESGMEYRDDPDMVFICEDFVNCHHFNYLHSLSKLIIGPALIRLRASLGKPLVMPRPNRPLYTESMAGVRIALCGLPNKQCREAVDLVHYMGGSARRTFSATTTHLITEAARGKIYRMAISMGCRTMHFEWMRAAWSLRDDLEAQVTSIDFITKYMVEPFCGLSLWFVNFAKEEEDDMRAKTTEHKGRVASQQQSATHVVVSNAPGACPEDVDAQQHLVTGEWFWISIQLNCCANEEIYQWKGQRRPNRKRTAVTPPASTDVPCRSSRLTLSKSSLDKLESSNSSALPDYSEHAFSTDDLEKLSVSPRKPDKRLAVCKEMLETEENYLKALKIIVQLFKDPLDKQLDNFESGLLSKAEVTQIFSRVPPLVEVHESICNELRGQIMHWSPDRRIGQVWLDHTTRLTPVYRAFINSYDTASEMLKFCDQTKPKFHAFLKAVESRTECQRNRLQDLLVRPVQRLPSVVLLLKAICKKTERSNPDYICLIKAMKSLEAVISNANETRRKTDSYTEIFRLSNEIERCPAEMLSSARTLTGELHVLSLGGEDEWAKTRGKHMSIFLFNDLIEIAKVRGGTESKSGTPIRSLVSRTGTLSRQLSFASLRHERKRYKHLQLYMLTAIRQIDVIKHSDIEGVFMLSFRVSQGEDFWVVQCLENQPGEMRRFLDALEFQIYHLCGRHTLMDDTDFDVQHPLMANSETVATVNKALHYAVRRNNVNTTMSETFLRPPSHFRRAVSSVQIGISQTLSRFHSRAHLTPVSETLQTTTIGPGASSTPHRTLRQMLSSNTFIPQRLSRRGSIRTNSEQV